MTLLDRLKNYFLYADKYKTDSEAVIIACYFNPQNNPYRLLAFNKFYDSIKHLNHRIVECVIGDAEPNLPLTPSITRVYTKDLLWHKESLLNGIIKTLPKKFKYVFWLDTDVLFTNKDWLVQGVEELKYNNIIQPFEYCVHLNEGEVSPSFNINEEKLFASEPSKRHPNIWRSFCANNKTNDLSGDINYDKHGHVGFAWGAKRSVLDIMPLYDKALIGGADHIIAHAAAGQINHSCLQKSFTEDIDAINDWSEDFEKLINGKISYVKGDLYHIWHGDISKRQYLKRIQDFTPKAKKITKKDVNGLFVADELEGDKYVDEYFEQREPKKIAPVNFGKQFTGGLKRNIPLNNAKNYINVTKEEFGLELTDFVAPILFESLLDQIEFENGQSQTVDLGESPGFEDGFGNGDFSGGGSGGSWGDEKVNDNTSDGYSQDTIDYSTSENFS